MQEPEVKYEMAEREHTTGTRAALDNQPSFAPPTQLQPSMSGSSIEFATTLEALTIRAQQHVPPKDSNIFAASLELDQERKLPAAAADVAKVQERTLPAADDDCDVSKHYANQQEGTGSYSDKSEVTRIALTTRLTLVIRITLTTRLAPVTLIILTT
jgi:hypothetical protein